ncbi:MAG: hypothetical protein IKO10_00345 [Lachnospiraceae bacterium]|nr:hypothetical protein [Lachnospiraceae bacterium]
MHKFKYLKSNKGSSLILVAALTVVIIGITVSLRILAGIIMASANQQLNQDQAYELATSLGNALEERIVNQGDDGKPLLNLETYVSSTEPTAEKQVMYRSGFMGMPDATVDAEVKKDAAGRFILTVKSNVGKATYLWTGIYQLDTTKGFVKCAE